MSLTILDGGDSTQQDGFTGPENALTVDESNRELRLHDGSTPGGHRILNRDANDGRYQLYSAELQGFVQLAPQDHGILVRLGPADYRLRSFYVDDANMVVVNADGYDGDIGFGFADTITSSHDWTGDHTFSDGDINFENGIHGNVDGDLQGDSFGTHTGNVIGDVTGDADGNHSGSFIGNLDVRGKTVHFDDAQIPLSALNGLLAYIRANAEQTGVIKIWSGSIASIPSGWALCNGLNGTPDFRNKFIMGAGDGSGGTSAPGATGGTSTVTPTVTVDAAAAHTHTVTATAANGVTGITLAKTMVRPENEQHQIDVVGNASITDPGHTHSVSGTAAAGGAHTHTATVSQISKLPPYYAYAFIMKVA